jgi:hypothetical protein
MPRKADIDAHYDATRKVLVITASNRGRADLADAYRRGNNGPTSGYYYAESHIAECFHEAYEFVDPGDVPGAMTDAPILVDSDGIARPDNGETIILPEARVFWFPNYAVEDPWETLKNRGRVEFSEGESDDPDAAPPPLVPADLADYLPGGARCGELFYIGGNGSADRNELPEPLRTLFIASVDDGRDLIDPGLYFAKRWRLLGPYAPTWSGQDHAMKAGAVEANPAPPEPEQPTLFA